MGSVFGLRALHTRAARLSRGSPPAILKIPNGTCFVSLFRTWYDSNAISVPWQQDIGSVFQEDVVQQRRDRKQEGLWWTAVTFTKVSPSAAVRRYARKRMRRQFVAELARAGYDQDGLPFSRDKPPMTGTLRLEVNVHILNVDQERLESEVRNVVTALLPTKVVTSHHQQGHTPSAMP